MTGRRPQTRAGPSPRAPLPEGLGQGLAEGLRHHRAGRLDRAAALYEQVLRADPRQPDALHLLGLVAHQSGDQDRAAGLVRRAIARNPRNAAYHNTLGAVLLALDRPEAAARSFREAIRLDPASPEAHNNLGNALQRAGDGDVAVASYRRALAARPDYAEALSNLAGALLGLGRLDEARAAVDRAIALRPGYASAHSNRGRILHDSGRYDDALASYDAALACDPGHAEAHANRATVLLLTGRFREGWDEYEWRWRTGGFTTPRRDFPQPPWDGNNPEGRTVFVHAEQGLGSAIQFARFVPLLAARGAEVVLECQPPLARLFSGLGSGSVRVITRGESPPPFDVHAPLMSLPRLFGTTLETIPADVPYLHADPEAVAAWRRRLADGGAPRVGLVWAGNRRHLNDRNRSMPAEHFAPLVEPGNARFVSLQVGEAPADASRLPGGAVVDLAPHLTDFAETAAAVASLDLVISVDTAVAHLAGALARPVWLLLPYVPEWRWLLDREDTPWYPTMRLFRQRAPGDWPELMTRVGEALAAMTESPSHAPAP